MRSTPTSPRVSLGRVLELLALTGMALIVIHVVLIVTGPNVADVRPFAVDIAGIDQVMSTRGRLVFPFDFGDRLSWIDTEAGTRDAATMLPPVELGEPVEAELSFWNPTPSQRASWAVRELFGPMLTLAGTWTVYRLVRSTRTGNPFVAENERRLWFLAGLVAVGATAHTIVSGFVDMLLIQRSAAADLFEVSTTISFLPIGVGLMIAMLALVWRIGTQMDEDLQGTI